MDALNVILGIAGCGGLGAIFYFLPQLLGKFNFNKVNSEEIFQQKQNIHQEIIKNNYQESVKLETKVNTIDNKLTVEKKEQISKIVETASKEIEDIMKKKSLSDIQNEIDIGWEDI